MMNHRKISFFVLTFFCLNQAQSQSISSLIKGHFSGSFENYSQYYMKDDKIGAFLPQDRFGSNSFLKLDYNYDKFTAGVQLESYLPPILGYYPVPFQNDTKIVNKYFKYKEKKFSIQVGDFYEQFGSGLIFRAFENRQIGINNAMEGLNAYVEPTKFMKLKVIYGRTRKLFEYSNSVTRGLDAEFALTDKLSMGGSYVGRYQEYTGAIDNFPATVNAFAGRMDYSGNDFSCNAEYVNKSKDPHLLNNQSFEKGNAFLLNAAYTKNNFGATASFRTLANMDFRAEREGEFSSIVPLNYLPALTKQHDYLTSNIYVYAAQPKGETGFQADVFYKFKPGTKLGGKLGTQIALNYSHYAGLSDSTNIFSKSGQNYFSDANLEVKKKVNKKLELSFAYQHIFYKSSVIQAVSEEDVVADIAAVGMLYKFAPKKSIRVKLEHLSTPDDKGNWVSGLTEFSFSSPYAFFISDLYNYGKTDNHYYNLGASVTKNSTRFAMQFGKQRAGLFCVGGVCRFVPASYGFTASLTTTFAN